MKHLHATMIALAVCSCAATAWADLYAGWTVGASADGYGTVLRTTDSGTTWTRQGAGQIADVNLFGISTVNSSTAWAVGNSAGGYATIYQTTDGGSTWLRKGSPINIPDMELGKVCAVSAAEAWAVGQGAILHTSDGGVTWANQIPAGYESTPLQGVYTPDGVNLWATGGNNNGCATILKSGDGGLSWTRQTGGQVNLADHLLGVSAVNANVAWTVGGKLSGGYNVLGTTDGGLTWTQQFSFGLGDANEVSAVNASTVWVACDSSLLRSTDSGQTWNTHTSPPYTMGISAVNSVEAWAVVSGITAGTILHTSDGGVTWNTQGISGETLAPLWTVSFAGTPVPEPTTLVLLACGSLAVLHHRKKTAV